MRPRENRCPDAAARDAMSTTQATATTLGGLRIPPPKRPRVSSLPGRAPGGDAGTPPSDAAGSRADARPEYASARFRTPRTGGNAEHPLQGGGADARALPTGRRAASRDAARAGAPVPDGRPHGGDDFPASGGADRRGSRPRPRGMRLSMRQGAPRDTRKDGRNEQETEERTKGVGRHPVETRITMGLEEGTSFYHSRSFFA